MNIGTRPARKAFIEIVDQFRLQIANSRRSHFGLNHRNRAASEIHRCQAESFIHGHQKIASSQDAAPITQSTVKCLPERDSHIFHGMMLIHIQITLGGEFQIEASVTRKQLQHVIEKTDTGGDLILPPALDGESNLNFCFRSLAM
jgi:hypothetical protein